jgi:hypothetical protein
MPDMFAPSPSYPSSFIISSIITIIITFIITTLFSLQQPTDDNRTN